MSTPPSPAVLAGWLSLLTVNRFASNAVFTECNTNVFRDNFGRLRYDRRMIRIIYQVYVCLRLPRVVLSSRCSNQAIIAHPVTWLGETQSTPFLQVCLLSVILGGTHFRVESEIRGESSSYYPRAEATSEEREEA